jgi:undecaprenyl-diphosphatase
MEYLQALVLGLVQGITEFLPISSTAHLIIFTDMLGWKDPWNKPATDAIQFGSVIAVVWYFRHDIRHILGGGWTALRQKAWEREEWKILVGIAIGTLPVLIGGFLKKRLPESTQAFLDGAIVITIALVVMALFLGLAERIGRRKRGFSQLKIADGFLVGLGQAVALIPGVSRSGATLTTALFLGLERQTAARFSFLLGIPALAIGTLVQAKDAVNNPQLFMPLIVGIISAAIFSYVFIAWLLRYLQTQSTWVFVWYRLALGSCLLLSIALGQLK